MFWSAVLSYTASEHKIKALLQQSEMSQSVMLSHKMSHGTAWNLKAPGYGWMSSSDSSWTAARGCPSPPFPLAHWCASPATCVNSSSPIPGKRNEIIVSNLSMKSLLTCFIAISLRRAHHDRLCQESWQGRNGKKCKSSDLFPLAPWLQRAPLSMPLRSLIYNPNVPPLLCSKTS